MTDPIVVSAIVATVGTIASGLGLAWLGRKWGLPGLGREVQTQQAALIQTMQAELSELRTQQTQDEALIKQLRTDLEVAEKKIEKQRGELLSLYRQLGKTVPNAF